MKIASATIKKTLWVILFLLSNAGLAQLIEPGTWSLYESREIAYFYDPGAYGMFSSYFIRKQHIDSAAISQTACVRGRPNKKPGVNTVVLFDSLGMTNSRTIYASGKMYFRYEYKRQPIPNRGREYSIKTWNHRYKLVYASVSKHDTIARTDSVWIKQTALAPLLLKRVSIRNLHNRSVREMDYNRKGMYAETVYAYDSTETALQTISSFKKGKLVRFTDYRCLPPKDTLKAEVSSICKRTDKDPMGNILEITERKIENKTYLVTKKIMPEKHLLLEVIMKGPNRRYSYRITYTYNEEGNLVELVRYERGKDKPVETRKFYYNKLLLERSEFLRKGQLKTVYTYEFRKTL